MTDMQTNRIELISPKDAEKMLATMGTNRPVSENKVLEYAIAMDTGSWALNGETIKFDVSGRLFDGQHRLKACILAGKSFRSYVVRGVTDQHAFSTVDVGKNRTHGDIFGIAGFSNSSLVASVGLIVYLHTNDRIGWAGLVGSTRRPKGLSDTIASKLKRMPGGVSVVQKEELLAFAEPIAERLTTAARYAERWKQSRVMARPIVGGAYYLFREKSFEDAERFFKDLDEGAGLAKTDPVYHLRERLLRNAVDDAKLTRWMIIGLTFKAWNKRREGEAVRSFRVQDGEEFPRKLK